ncbi:hypothetical protein VCHA53O466_50359 [Vibrio chagasii]|nr:hypothetical protein VCHA53O466_50359 [Vibrio chagasii]
MELIKKAKQKVSSIIEKNPDLPPEIANQLRVITRNIKNSESQLVKRELNLVFIGKAGVGKTSLVSSLTDLIDRNNDNEPLLQTSSGKTTLCEVEIKYSTINKFEITPVSPHEFLDMIDSFINLIDSTPQKKKSILSVEQIRYIRAMSGLGFTSRVDRGGKRIKIDKADLKFIELNEDREAFRDYLLSEINIPRRTRTSISFTHVGDAETFERELNDFIKTNFKSLNLGKNKDFPMPSKIVLYTEKMKKLKDALPDVDHLSVFDTKGLDEQVNRKDIDIHIGNQSSACFFCTTFNDAPDEATRAIIKRAINVGNSERLFSKSSVIALERNNESRDVLLDFDDDDIDVEHEGDLSTFLGRQEREANIEGTLLQDPEIGHKLPVAFIDVHREPVDGMLEHVSSIGKSIELSHHSAILDSLNCLEQIEVKFKDARTAKTFRYLSKLMSSRLKMLEYYKRPRDCSRGLIDVIKSGSVFSSSLAASTRREGHWDTIDFHHELKMALRRQLVNDYNRSLERYISDLRMVQKRDDFSPTHDYINEVVRLIESQRSEFWESADQIVEEIYSHNLVKDSQLWEDLIGEWGRGSGYKIRVSNRLDEWFEGRRSITESKMNELVRQEWKALLSFIRRAF